VAAGSLLITEAGGLVGNFSGDANFLEQKECMAANPRIYGQMVALLGKYSKFAGAGEKASVRAAVAEMARTTETVTAAEDTLPAAPAADLPDAPF
jgi:myo-inositol-1(or 4)-monophosphatase